MADLDFTQSKVEILAHQNVALDASVVGSAVSVAGYLSGVLYVFHANLDATANLTAGLDFIDIETSPEANDTTLTLWSSFRKLIPGSTVGSETFSADEAAGQTVLTVAATADLTEGEMIYIEDKTSVATSEWNKIVTVVANTSVTVATPIVTGKDTSDGDMIYDGAACWPVYMDFAGVSRIRVSVVHQGATGSANWRVYAVLLAATGIG